MIKRFFGMVFWTGLFVILSSSASHANTTLRVGYFPNITHAHALIAQNMASEGKGWYEKRLPNVKIQWQSFNAGPSAMEAMFARSLDLTYVGPSPALNAFIRSKNKGISVISGAVRGGAGLVVPQNSSLNKPQDFKGKKIATPQLGNTQDIACRHWLTQAGLHVTQTGGDVSVVPTRNPNMLPLFVTGEIDAAWTVEPWLSRLEMEGKGRLIYAEPAAESITTILVANSEFMQKSPDLMRQFYQAHAELTEWIKQNPKEAQRRVADELSKQTRRTFPIKLVEHAWPRLVFDNKITVDNFRFSLKAAQNAGFIKEKHDITHIVSVP
ncbi:MAG: ABC transporter substrate-binding protein [Betaproteobacteria bacterium]|nr:ABC transporter substrate-binding protein [Betaproteobacteria bacterium]